MDQSLTYVIASILLSAVKKAKDSSSKFEADKRQWPSPQSDGDIIAGRLTGEACIDSGSTLTVSGLVKAHLEYFPSARVYHALMMKLGSSRCISWGPDEMR